MVDRFGIVLSVFQSYTQTSYYNKFTDQFKRLNAVLEEFEVKDHREQPFLKVKMIDLNRKTLPLYKRLDEKISPSTNLFETSKIIDDTFQVESPHYWIRYG